MHARTPSRSLTAGLRPVALSAALAATLALGAVASARADAPKHPHYLQALADLKHAHTLLDPVSAPGVHPTQAAIDRAIAEIQRAAFADRESLEKTPRIDTSMANETRYQEVQKLLRSAERDLGYEEDDKAALGWRKRAMTAIDDARRLVERSEKQAHS